jgi:hypothetical protein
MESATAAMPRDSIDRAMKKSPLIAGFLVFFEAIGCAASYTKQFGDAGGLLIQYDWSWMTSANPTTGSTFTNVISGTLTNTTKLPIRCKTIEPIVPGYSRSRGPGGLEHVVGLDAGALQAFRREESFSRDASKNVTGPVISGWTVECATPLDYQFSSQVVTMKVPAGIATGVIGKTGVGITVENNSDQPIAIVWNESSLIDMNRSAKRIFHSGVKYTDREQSLPNTTIPPLAKVEDTAIPTENVFFIEGRNGGWSEIPLFPSEVPPELAEKTMASMKGAKVALFLQLLVDEKKTPVTLLFEVAAVKPGNPK